MRKQHRMSHLKKRLRWLLDSESLRREPLKLLYRIISWEIVRIVGHPIIEYLEKDLAVILHPSEGYGRVIHYFRFNKPSIAQFYEVFLEEGMVYIDCGANIGIYSIFAAKRVGRKGTVYSFEPHPVIYHRLLANIHLNRLDNIHSYRMAVGDRGEWVELVPLHDHVASYVRPILDKTTSPWSCEATTLDSFFMDKAIERIDLLKIDVEGYEYKVLQGARRTIDRFKPSLIQFEYYREYPLLPRTEWPTLDLYRSFFAEMGYDGFFCVGKRTNLLEPLVEEDPQDNDVFCIDSRKMQEIRGKVFARAGDHKIENLKNLYYDRFNTPISIGTGRQPVIGTTTAITES